MVGKISFTQRVREAADKLERFGISELSIEMEVQTYGEIRRIRRVITELKKTGEIKAVSRGVYAYNKGCTAGRSKDVMKRIHRAIWASGSFVTRDIVMRSSAERSYAAVVIRQLIASEDIEKIGKVKTRKGHGEMSFRVRHMDRFYLKYIRQQGENA